MWPSRKKKFKSLYDSLADYSKHKQELVGVRDNQARETLAMQMVASIRRLDYTRLIKVRPIDPARANPNSKMFDPERAALIHARAGNLDEAFWLIFLATHFGKNGAHGWRLLIDVYSGLGKGTWTWARVSKSPLAFYKWLQANHASFGGGFGNHRRYETLQPGSNKGTHLVVESYLKWIGPTQSHQQFVADLVREAGNEPYKIFDHFFNSMQVYRFGRLGKFDFFSLLGRLDLAPIEPGSTYLKGATGPLRGARLLFAGDVNAKLKISKLEADLFELGQVLDIGMQVMEDSLCNWQKSPNHFINFIG